MGTQGYNTRDEVLYLEKRWLKLDLDPDLILIVFYLNDVYRDRTFMNMGEGTGIYLLPPNRLAEYSLLFDYAQHEWRARSVRSKLDEYYQQHYFTKPGKYLAEAIHSLIRKTCEELNIPVVDLLDSFRGHKAAELWVHPSDHHPNEVAHEIAAKSIETFVRARFLDKD